jgi:ABC-type antimicrobial peptide transport system permease subunit
MVAMIKKRFAIGFAVGVITFIIINLIAAHLASDCGLLAVIGRDACADDIARLGWPLQFYEEGGFAYRFIFNPLTLSLDLGIAVLLSIVSGWLFTRLSK